MGNLAPAHKFKIGVAKQASEGTPAAAPEFYIPAYGGDIMPTEVRNRHEVADGLPYRPGGYKSMGRWEGSPQFACFPDSLGRLIHGHFGVDTLSGAGDPYLHAETRSDSQPWHTFWKASPKPDGTFIWERFDDGLIKALEFAWAAGQPLRVTAELIGKAARGNVAAPVGGTTNKLDNSESWFTSIAAVLLMDIDDTPAATQKRNVESFTLRFAYDELDLIQTDEFNPRFRDPGLWTIGFSADTLLEDYEAYLATFYGAKDAADAVQSLVIPAGSANLTFQVAPEVDADRTLQALLPSLEYTASVPGLDVSGRALRETLTAVVQQPASGEPATLKLKNARATTY